MKTLRNDSLTVQISEFGAELTSMCNNATGREYIWQGDPAFWKRHSPILFPIVGSLWERQYRYKSKLYGMYQHGFARDMDFELIQESDSSAYFQLRSTEETRGVFPFNFKLSVRYILRDNWLAVEWHVENCSRKEMHFQIGAHPAFNFPDFDPNTSERGFFAFDKTEGLDYIRIAEKGCVSKQTYPLPLVDGLMPIDTHTFDIDTYILENSQISRVSLLDKSRKPYLSVLFDAPVLGLWSPAGKNAPFVCIEPWFGRCDEVGYKGTFENREWTNHLPIGGIMSFIYVIRIDE